MIKSEMELHEQEPLHQAIQAAQIGDRTGAGKLLARIVSEDPGNEMAWVWLAVCVGDSEKKRFCLEKALALNPENSTARQALAKLAPPPPTPAEIPIAEDSAAPHNAPLDVSLDAPIEAPAPRPTQTRAERLRQKRASRTPVSAVRRFNPRQRFLIGLFVLFILADLFVLYRLLLAPALLGPVSAPVAAALGQTATPAPPTGQTAEAAASASAPTPARTYTPPPPLPASAWKKLPIVPTVDERARQIYQQGIEKGANPRAFSKVGDCESTLPWFLGDFDLGPEKYELGPYQDLKQVIQYYQGSYGRESLAAKNGFNSSSLLSPLWADQKYCKPDETPLACEYRLHRPSLALISLGTNDSYMPDIFEDRMREVIEFTIQQGVLPVLSTKADNLDDGDVINRVTADLAREYGIPLWNYWAAVQKLPNGGIQPDGAHLTFDINDFSDPLVLKESAWPVRNLTALQTLNAIWRGVTAP